LKVQLKRLYCRYFQYSEELMEYILRMFNVYEAFNFLEMMEKPRPVTIRVNTLKARKREVAQKLIQKGVVLESVDEICKVCLKINKSQVPIGATPEYLSGMYMLQSAASMLPVMALSPQPGDYVLDMAAAPGGKTTHIAQVMKNQGLIVANDVKKERMISLNYNVQRLGIKNVILTNYDGRKLPPSLKNFDRVLLDAPCTGLGVISRDKSIKQNRTLKDVYRASHLQKELLRKAIDLCKVGGYVVYSTCSFAVEENEEVVDYAVRNRFVKIIDTGLDIESRVISKFGDKKFHDRVKHCIRVYPHVNNLDGFFVCKLKKLKDGSRFEQEEAK
jgi:ribosomal RNA methyltransferase Nop2